MLAAVSAPFVVAGQGRAVRSAYTDAVDFYPALTMNAANVWQPVRLVNLYVRHLDDAARHDDAVRWAGPVTPKRVGLALFAAYTPPWRPACGGGPTAPRWPGRRPCRRSPSSCCRRRCTSGTWSPPRPCSR